MFGIFVIYSKNYYKKNHMDFALAAFTNTVVATGNSLCDKVAPMTNFNGAAYMGVWYEQDHVINQGFQLDSWTCTQANYSGL